MSEKGGVYFCKQTSTKQMWTKLKVCKKTTEENPNPTDKVINKRYFPITAKQDIHNDS